MNAYVIKDAQYTGSTLYVRRERENILLTIIQEDKALMIALDEFNTKNLRDLLSKAILE